MINKKGILPLIPLIIIIGAILVFVTAVAFVEQIKYVVLFVSLMIVLFWFLKDGKLSGNDYIGIIVIMGIGAFFLFGGFGLLEQTTTGQSYVEIQAYGFYECKPSSTTQLKTSNPYIIPEDGTGFFKCGFSEVKTTDKCSLDINIPNDNKFTFFGIKTKVVYQICDLDGVDDGLCQPQKTVFEDQVTSQGKTIQDVIVPYNHYIWIDALRQKTINVPDWVFSEGYPVGQYRGSEGGTFVIQWTPYVLHKKTIGEGTKEVTNVNEGCKFRTSDNKNLLTSFLSLPGINPSNIKSSSLKELQPKQAWNFVELTLPVNAESADFVKGGYCRDTTIYKVDTVKTKSGQTDYVNFQKPIDTSPQCCPSFESPTQFCDSNLKLKNLKIDEKTGETEKECSLPFNPCSNNIFQPESSNTISAFECIQNQCVQKTKIVECAFSSDCGANEVCDISAGDTQWECIETELGEGFEFGESETGGGGQPLPPSSVFLEEEECGFGQTSSTETEIIGKGPLGIGKWFGLTEEITTEKCVTSGWIIWVIFGSVVMVLGITFILVNRKKR